MNVENVKKLIETNATLRNSLSEYIDDYVEWVKSNVPAGLESKFGVGVVSDNRYGTYWGFYNREKDSYTCTGSSWYAGNDWRCKVYGSSVKQMREFARATPSYVEQGIGAMLSENIDIEDILNSGIKFE